MAVLHIDIHIAFLMVQS